MEDPYFSTDFAAERLFKEYSLHKKLVVAVDFDDTIFNYHGKDFSYPKVINLLLECQKLGFWICVFTGSPLDKYPSIHEYMDKIGIKIHTINKNPFPLPFGNDGKMYYNILLDDRAGLGQACEILRKVLDRVAATV